MWNLREGCQHGRNFGGSWSLFQPWMVACSFVAGLGDSTSRVLISENDLNLYEREPND
jgi:hypothetical protein